MNLYHYRPVADEIYRVPILVVMATTNRGYLLDMVPGESLIEFLLKPGYDVYMLDWCAPVARDFCARARRRAGKVIGPDDRRSAGGDHAVRKLGFQGRGCLAQPCEGCRWQEARHRRSRHNVAQVRAQLEAYGLPGARCARIGASSAGSSGITPNNRACHEFVISRCTINVAPHH